MLGCFLRMIYNAFIFLWLYLSDFTVNEVKYSSMEQFMMYKKAICFQDVEKAQQILSTNDVALIKEYGRQVKGYNDSIWCGIRQIVVYQGLLAKFSQNNILYNKLLQTHNDIFAECAVKDRVWGIGLSMNDPQRLDLAKWRGQNLLGYTLMMVREELR